MGVWGTRSRWQSVLPPDGPSDDERTHPKISDTVPDGPGVPGVPGHPSGESLNRPGIFTPSLERMEQCEGKPPVRKCPTCTKAISILLPFTIGAGNRDISGFIPSEAGSGSGEAEEGELLRW
jgi:hypothetical protein